MKTPKWLEGMVAPTLMLWLYIFALVVASEFGNEDGGLKKPADLLSRVGFALVVSSWVMADARKRGRKLCYDYDSIVYFAWALVVPVYLFQTRGARAWLTLLCFGIIWVIALLFQIVISLFRDQAG